MGCTFPRGPILDILKWLNLSPQPDTNSTISLKLLKGKAPDDMEECETIAGLSRLRDFVIHDLYAHTLCSDHIKNTGTHIWLTGDWLEDSSTMKAGYKYGLKIIDDETGNYNYSPSFDLIVPHSTFTQQGKDEKPPKKGSTKDTTDDEPDFEEPDGTAPKGQNRNHGNNKKPKPQSVANVDTQTTITKQKQQSTTTKSKALPKAAAIGIAMAVIVVIAAISLGIGWWKLHKYKKIMAEKKQSRVGYDGVGDFIAKSRSGSLYGGPQMAQYTPRQSIETRYDPPTGQGLPVVGSTPRHSVDTKYDPPSRHSVDTRYDPPSQAPQAHQ